MRLIVSTDSTTARFTSGAVIGHSLGAKAAALALTRGAEADRVVFLDQGDVVEQATPEAFFSAAKSERARQFLVLVPPCLYGSMNVAVQAMNEMAAQSAITAADANASGIPAGPAFEVMLGDVTKTVQNLDVVRVDEARQLLLVRGAVPGAKNGHVVVRPAVKVKVKKGAN